MLLERFSMKDIKEFKHDFFLIMKVAFEIDEEFGGVDAEADRNLPIFQQCLDLFNKKYPGIYLGVKENYNEFKIDIFLYEESLKKLFMECGFKIPGLQSIGDDHNNIDELQDKDAVLKELDTVKDTLYLHYSGYNEGTVIVRNSTGRVQLCYSQENLLNETEPEFQICCFYALSKGYNTNIDLSPFQSRFVFMSTSSDKLREPS